MPHRIAFGSCSHPSLPQPLWKIIKSRHPTAFVWGGDAIYADKYAGLNWTAVGWERINDDQTQNNTSSSWRLTFPPPSIHTDATPAIINGWYEKQWGVEDYRSFVEGWYEDKHHINNTSQSHNNIMKPLLFGTVDDHDYGQNNGDYTYQYKKESNIEFVNFLYSRVANDQHPNECVAQDVHNDNVCEESTSQQQASKNGSYDRQKANDPMYQRALKGKGVYGVQLFDFSKTKNDHTSNKNNHILWGDGYWVPESVAQIDPDVITSDNISSSETPGYSTTHSVAIFALDVRSNKTPWPKGKQIHTESTIQDTNSSSSNNIPILDFLGEQQWLWFEQALNNSHATVNIIVSGLQVHPGKSESVLFELSLPLCDCLCKPHVLTFVAITSLSSLFQNVFRTMAML